MSRRDDIIPYSRLFARFLDPYRVSQMAVGWLPEYDENEMSYIEYRIKLAYTRYGERIERYVKDGTIFIVNWFIEGPLERWLTAHYKDIGFESIIQEQTVEYEQKRRELHFDGNPDFLVLRNGKWLRLELETESSHYKIHTVRNPEGFADILLCYYITGWSPNIETIQLTDVLNVRCVVPEELLLEFLYEYDEAFRNEYLSIRSLAEQRFANDPDA